MSMIHRLPSSEVVGLKDDFNGPICYTPDGNPLVGPVPGLRNMWIAEGFSFGITAAGGTGYYLAQMMVNGEADQRVAIGRVADRAVEIVLQANHFRRRQAVDHRHVFGFDPLKVQREQVGAEAVGDVVFEA